MSTQAQYSTTPKFGMAQISVANTNRDGTGSVPQVVGAGATGSRVDKIVVEATVTTSAGMVRLFVTEGTPGETVSSITFVGTTATVTTATSHGLATGDLVTVQGFRPRQYNVKDTAITVLTATTFSYAMATAPTINAGTIGSYFTTPAVPVSRLIGEVPVSAAVPSGTVQAFQSILTPLTTAFLPLVLPAGYSLRASTHNAETFNVIGQAGDF